MRYAVLFGGASYEHEISIVSAITLKKVLGDTLFIFLDAEGRFFEIPAAKMRSDLFSGGGYAKERALELTSEGFVAKGLFGSKPVRFDRLINLVHGAQGEDGTLAALLDFYGIDYIGPRPEASVVSYNKWLTKRYAEGVGIKTLDYRLIRAYGPREVDLPLPLIVKPLRLGSSIGVEVVKEPGELDYALDVAFEFDDEALVEPFIEGVAEYNVAGCKTAKGWLIGTVEAPQKRELLDFEQKYLDFSRTDGVAQAELPDDLVQRLQEAFKRIYGHLFDGALIRCDFFVLKGEIYLNEINPIPGSLANYLFDDFWAVLDALAKSLPKRRRIRPDYAYIDKVQRAKGPKTGRDV